MGCETRNGDVLEDSYSILNGMKEYFTQSLKLHRLSQMFSNADFYLTSTLTCVIGKITNKDAFTQYMS